MPQLAQGTTVAAAAAVALAKRGLSVHLTTTDPAQHISETLQAEVAGLRVSCARGNSTAQLFPVLLLLALVLGTVLRSVLGRLPGALATGGAAALIAWLVAGTAVIALVAGVIAFLFTLFTGGMGGRGAGGRYLGGYYGGIGRGGFGGGRGFRGRGPPAGPGVPRQQKRSHAITATCAAEDRW